MLEYTGMNKNSNKIFWLVFSLGIVWLLFIYIRFPKSAWAEGLLEAWYSSKGLVFYKDFTSRYFPILYMMMIPLHKIFGFSQTTTIILAPINSLLVFVLLAFVSSRWLKNWYKIIPLIFFLIWNPILSENHFTTPSFHALVNFIAFASWLAWLKKPSHLVSLFIGLFLSLSVMSMQIEIVYALLIFISLFLSSSKDSKSIQRLLITFFAFVTPGVFVVIWFMFKGAFGDFYYWTVSYYLFGYPFATSGREQGVILTFIAVFSPFILFLWSLVMHRIKTIKLSQKIMLILIVTVHPILYLYAIFHPLRFQMALPIYAYIFGFSVQTVLATKIKFNKFRLISPLLISIIIVLNTVGFLYYALPAYRKNLDLSSKYKIITEIDENDPMFDAVQWVKENTSEDSKLFVMADPMFYFESNRLPAHPLGTMNQPFVYEPLDKFKETIKLRPPDYWVIDERLVNQRFKEFGYEQTTVFFNKLLECEEVVARIEYITIRKHNPQKQFCF